MLMSDGAQKERLQETTRISDGHASKESGVGLTDSEPRLAMPRIGLGSHPKAAATFRQTRIRGAIEREGPRLGWP